MLLPLCRRSDCSTFSFYFIPRVIENQRRSERKTKKMACLCVCFFQVPKAADLTKKVANNNSNQNPMVYSHPGSVGIQMCYVLSCLQRKRKEIFFR
jgi:hypothetical protein